VAQLPESASPEEFKLEGQELEKGNVSDEQATGRWQGWRIVQIGLGIVLAGLLVAIVWLRGWGRLG
jgi:hypothetical protein